MSTPVASPPVEAWSPRSSSERNTQWAFGMVTSIFFLWGFLTCLNDIMIPHLKGVFALSYAQSMMVQFCFFSAYFFVSIPAGRWVEKIGYRRGMIGGLITAAVGTLLFQPAAVLPSFPLFLAGFFILASGITLLQVAANPYVTALGAPQTASSRLNLAQAFNSLGTTLAPLFGAALILGAATGALSAAERAQAVRLPYLFITFALLALAAVLAFFRLPELTAAPRARTAGERPARSAWSYPHLTGGALAIFAYVGGEVAVGSFLVSFLGEAHILGFSAETAGHAVSLYWGGAMIGRFAGAWLLTRVQPARVLTANAVGAVILLAIALLFQGPVAAIAVLLVGLLNSVLFPTIFTLAIEGLGAATAQGSGILCSAIVGGAVIPLVQGWASDSWGVQAGFAIPLLCYVAVAAYGAFRVQGRT